MWLLIEWRDNEDAPATCFLCSLPGRPTKKQLVRRVMQRWRIERTSQDLKDELGLDHYEGRRFPGWHHHVSVVLCCYAFVIADHADCETTAALARWQRLAEHPTSRAI